MNFKFILLVSVIVSVIVKYGSWLLIEVLEYTQKLNVFEWFITIFVVLAVMRYLKLIEKE